MACGWRQCTYLGLVEYPVVVGVIGKCSLNASCGTRDVVVRNWSDLDRHNVAERLEFKIVATMQNSLSGSDTQRNVRRNNVRLAKGVRKSRFVESPDWSICPIKRGVLA